MASRPSIFGSLLFIALLLVVARSRPMSHVEANSRLSASDLVARLKLSDDQEEPGCWNSVFELQACTEEIITFFVNGETLLGAGCCKAIETIEHQCWPGLLGTLGFTKEEGNILDGYCSTAPELDG